MNNLIEWMLALLLILIVLVIFVFGGVLLTTLFVALFCGAVIVATLDVIQTAYRWFFSLFSSKEKSDGPS